MYEEGGGVAGGKEGGREKEKRERETQDETWTVSGILHQGKGLWGRRRG